jgi:hypothetical protein
MSMHVILDFCEEPSIHVLKNKIGIIFGFGSKSTHKIEPGIYLFIYLISGPVLPKKI